MDMPTPTPEHRRLERLAGTWRLEETMHPSPWDPTGGKATGHSHARVSAGGFCVAGDYRQERGEKTTFEGHSVFTYDANERCYLLYWWDSMGMPVDVFRGDWEGDRLLMSSRSPMGHFRLSYEFPAPGRLRNRMEISEDGATWRILFESEGTRTD